MSLGGDFYREAAQKVRIYAADNDNDGYPFYKEQEAGTNDNDASDKPANKRRAER